MKLLRTETYGKNKVLTTNWPSQNVSQTPSLAETSPSCHNILENMFRYCANTHFLAQTHHHQQKH